MKIIGCSPTLVRAAWRLYDKARAGEGSRLYLLKMGLLMHIQATRNFQREVPTCDVPVRALAKLSGTGVKKVAQALEELEAEGLVRRVPYSGTEFSNGCQGAMKKPRAYMMTYEGMTMVGENEEEVAAPLPPKKWYFTDGEEVPKGVEVKARDDGKSYVKMEREGKPGVFHFVYETPA